MQERVIAIFADDRVDDECGHSPDTSRWSVAVLVFAIDDAAFAQLTSERSSMCDHIKTCRAKDIGVEIGSQFIRC